MESYKNSSKFTCFLIFDLFKWSSFFEVHSGNVPCQIGQVSLEVIQSLCEDDNLVSRVNQCRDGEDREDSVGEAKTTMSLDSWWSGGIEDISARAGTFPFRDRCTFVVWMWNILHLTEFVLVFASLHSATHTHKTFKLLARLIPRINLLACVLCTAFLLIEQVTIAVVRSETICVRAQQRKQWQLIRTAASDSFTVLVCEGARSSLLPRLQSQ